MYSSLDEFTESPSEVNLQQLEEKQFIYSDSATSEAEKLALLILDCNLGYYNNRFGNTQKAIEFYERAWENYNKHTFETYDITEFCLKPLGNLYTVTGAFTNAESTIKQYIFLAEKNKNQAQQIAGFINLSVVYHNTGNYNTAILILQNALLNEKLDDAQKALLKNNLATNLFAMGRYVEAQKLVSQALKNGNLVSANVYKSAAQLAVQDRDFTLAEQYFGNAEKALLKEDAFSARELAKLYEEWSQLYFLQSRNQDATHYLHKALHSLLPNLEKDAPLENSILYAENTFTSIFDGLALLESNPEKALSYYDLSFYVSGQEAKILHQLDDRLRSEKCIALLYETYKDSNDPKMKEAAFGYAERSKAVVLSEMQLKQSLLSQHLNDTLLQEEQQLMRNQEALINNLVRSQLLGGDSQNINQITVSLNRVHLELRNISKAIALKYPKRAVKTISSQVLQTKLKEDNALLYYYFFGREALYYFRISENNMEFHRKEITPDFNEIVSEYIHFFDNSAAINNDIPKFTEGSFKLFQELQLKNLSEGKNLIIIPDGLLNFVSFDGLLTKKSTSLIFSKMPFLVKQQRLAYTTNATFYVNAKGKTKGNKVLAFVPVFENTRNELKFSVDEAKSLEKEVGAKLYERKLATKANFINQAPRYDVLHLSTHASGGTFTIPANIEFIDDTMLLHELYSLELHPKLVVLSACETGVGKLLKGEGAMSVARGFQYAGAQNLLFSLWKVNDLSTAQLMDSFYKSFSKTGSAFEANRTSKIDYLKNGKINNLKKSPYYWSSFVYYGELSEAQNSYHLIIVLVGLLLIVLFILAFRRKRK